MSSSVRQNLTPSIRFINSKKNFLLDYFFENEFKFSGGEDFLLRAKIYGDGFIFGNINLSKG